MPEFLIKLIPGVNAEFTPLLNQGGISVSNLIRFEAGLPQKIGGWTRFYPNALAGVPRDLHAWSDLNAVPRLSIGATTSLNVITEDVLQTITPQVTTTNPAPDFTTTSSSANVEVTDLDIADLTTFDAAFFNTPVSVGGIVLHGLYAIEQITGTHSYIITANTVATSSETNAGAVPVFDTTADSAIVQVTLANHGLSVGDDFTFPIATSAGGAVIDGTYPVQSIVNVNAFTIGVSSAATSTATVSMNGGNVQFVYYISLGPPAGGAGYGLGGYGDGGYGTGVTPSVATGTPITTDNWSSDNWGEILLVCPKDGGIYNWPPNAGYATAFLVRTAPIFNGGIFVAMPEQILVAWGSTAAAPSAVGFTSSPEQQDPLIVRWSDAEDFTQWAVNSNTQAGSFRIPTGSEIRGAIQAPQQALVWTDIELWAMQYLGPPLVFGFNKLSSGCGLIGRHAMGVMRGIVFWMSEGSFFMLGGSGVQEIPCSVWDVVFQDLDKDNADKITCAVNSQFSEVTWYYPSLSGATGEPDKYVKLNPGEKFVWDYGSLSRSAWIDQSVLGQAIGAQPNGVIFQHETSKNGDGQVINSYFETGWFMISEGQELSFVDWLFPDMKFGYYNGAQNATVMVTMSTAEYPNSTPVSFGPFNMTATQPYLNPRLRGRYAKIRFESADLDSWWRMGVPTYRVAKDGRR